jgi:hypothetical protein
MIFIKFKKYCPTMPKYWLDGIFDDTVMEDLVVDKDMVMSEAMDVEESDDEMDMDVLKTVEKARVVICRNFVYCENAGCLKRHWYQTGIKKRVSRMKGCFEEAKILDRWLRRYAKNNGGIVVVE